MKKSMDFDSILLCIWLIGTYIYICIKDNKGLVTICYLGFILILIIVRALKVKSIKKFNDTNYKVRSIVENDDVVIEEKKDEVLPIYYNYGLRKYTLLIINAVFMFFVVFSLILIRSVTLGYVFIFICVILHIIRSYLHDYKILKRYYESNKNNIDMEYEGPNTYYDYFLSNVIRCKYINEYETIKIKENDLIFAFSNTQYVNYRKASNNYAINVCCTLEKPENSKLVITNNSGTYFRYNTMLKYFPTNYSNLLPYLTDSEYFDRPENVINSILKETSDFFTKTRLGCTLLVYDNKIVLVIHQARFGKLEEQFDKEKTFKEIDETIFEIKEYMTKIVKALK